MLSMMTKIQKYTFIYLQIYRKYPDVNYQYYPLLSKY